MTNCGAPDWTPYTAEEDQPVPGGIYPHSVWDLAGITQVLKHAYARNETVIVYTVPAGKVFYLTSLWMHYTRKAAGVLGVYVAIKDKPGATPVTFVSSSFVIGDNITALSFATPVKIWAEGEVACSSQNLDMVIRCVITGFTLDA